MTADELIAKRLSRIETIPDRFINKVNATQQELFAELVELLNALDTKGGAIVLSESNMNAVEELIDEYYQRIKDGPYGSLVSGYMQELDVQKTLIDQFAKVEYNAIAVRAAQAAYTNSRAVALQQLIGDDFKTNFINVIRDQLTTAVETNSGFSATLKSLQKLFQNDPIDGQILNWTKQVASDRFAITDRSYSNAVADQLGLLFGVYSGGLIDDSRPFCISRAGKYFHINEVRKWGTVPADWAGRYRRTNSDNIVQWLGGYRCQHIFTYRSLINIPKTVLERNIANGNWKPSVAEKSLLNL